MTATASGTRKSGTRKPAAKPASLTLRPATAPAYPPGTQEPDGEAGPAGFEVLRLTPVSDPEPARRVPLFTITLSGKERVYTVLADPQPVIGLEYTHRCRTEGVGMALDWLLEAMLGTEGYSALRGYDQLTSADIGRVMDVVLKITLGALDIPKDG